MDMREKFYKKKRAEKEATSPPHMKMAIGFGCIFFATFIGCLVSMFDGEPFVKSIVASLVTSFVITAMLAFYIWLAFIPATIGERKGHDFWTIFFISIFISWPATLVVVLLLPEKGEVSRKDAARFSCPECGESIAVAARSCRFCSAIITDEDKPKTIQKTLRK